MPSTITINVQIVDFVLDCANSHDLHLVDEAIRASLLLFNLDKGRFRAVVENYFNKSDHNRIVVYSCLRSNFLSDSDFELSLLKKWNMSNSQYVINWAMTIMAHRLYKGQIDRNMLIDEALRAIKRCCNIENLTVLYNHSLLKELGIANIGYALDYFECIIEDEENYGILYCYNSIVRDIKGSGNRISEGFG